MLPHRYCLLLLKETILFKISFAYMQTQWRQLATMEKPLCPTCVACIWSVEQHWWSLGLLDFKAPIFRGSKVNLIGFYNVNDVVHNLSLSCSIGSVLTNWVCFMFLYFLNILDFFGLACYSLKVQGLTGNLLGQDNYKEFWIWVHLYLFKRLDLNHIKIEFWSD